MDDTLRYVAVGVSIVCVLVWVWLVRVHPPLWPTVALPIALFLHTIMFYAVAIDRHAMPSVDLTIWSNGLRLHELFTWMVGGLIMGFLMTRAKRAGQK